MAYGISTILYATDLGPRGPEVFRHAAGIARRFEAKVHILTVIEAIGDYANVTLDAYVPNEIIEQIRTDGIKRIREDLDSRLAAFDAANPDLASKDVVASVQILEGNAAELILKEAERLKADLIVLGSHGHSAIGEMLIGSVAHKITVRSDVPVLLVPINK
ncbi:universal stress protein [Plasticicumulans acidivorans]|uniref:Nucleotide-binding universal stress UspA family protein n=1 Tax=Plasticicumulans acidivorans TaxID=886464 RepID=A0A317MZ27_9GAMM|nr:universal stress protein [Plasticicumulans acidivorans]PWV63542.1 nucleotide-binding universal stress UspA family protein [Plasticicumulans acidivorans]